MAQKRDRPPRGIQASPDRVQAAWERRIQDKVGDSDLSLGDIETLIGLVSSQKTAINNLQNQIDNLGKRLELLNKPQTAEEVKRQLDELENTVWLLHRN